MAHAKVVHWYREEIRGSAQWSYKSSFSNGFGIPLEPLNAEDIAAANRAQDFQLGWIAYPIYLGKQVPDSVLTTLGSKAPRFTDAELAYAKGTCDFMAVDYYVTSYQTSPPGGIEACARNSSHPAFPICTVSVLSRAGWPVVRNSFPLSLVHSIYTKHIAE